jgi:hypothetical protein
MDGGSSRRTNGSPYSERSSVAQLFLQALQDRSKGVHEPSESAPGRPGDDERDDERREKLRPTVNVTAALPIGGRIKVDPWNDQLMLLKAKSIGVVAEDEKKPLQITPFVFY